MDFKKGDILTGQVEDFSHEGNGVVKIDDFVFFLDGGVIGDKVSFKISRLKKNFGNGEIVEILEKSDDRVEYKLKESRGGIPLINYKYEKQLEWKKSKIENDLYKFAEIEDFDVKGPIGMENPFNYRNHVQIPVNTFQGVNYIGFYEQGTRRVIDMDSTILLSAEGNKVFKIVKDWINENKIVGYNSRRNEGMLRHIGIRVNKDDEIMLILVSNSSNLPALDELLEELADTKVVSVYQNINREKTSQVYGKEYKKIYGEEYLLDHIGGMKFKISPNSFFQVNRAQTEVLYDKVKEYLDGNEEDIVLDLYSGIGSISLYIAEDVHMVYGVEVVEEAVKDANRNAELNGIENVDFIAGYTRHALKQLINEGVNANKVVLDPPRSGCEAGVIDSLIGLKPEKIVYVSCQPSTVARDIKLLLDNGYELTEMTAVDMFPNTSHIETIALLQKEIS